MLVWSLPRMSQGRTWEDELWKEINSMASETVQQVVEYLRAHPDVAQRAREYVRTHPDDVKSALKEVAAQRGWDLSKIDPASLKAEIGKL